MKARAVAVDRKSMTLRGHLVELRNRFFLVFGVLMVAATVAYVFREPLIAGLLAPLEGRQLQYLTPGGGFKFIFSIIFFAGLAVSIPLLIQQIYAFLSPVLSDKVRSRSGWLLLWSTILLIIGVTFGYIYAVPGALEFLYGFADQFVVSALTADAYLDFVIKYTIGLGLVFQIPLIMMIVHWIKPQKPLKLLKFERWVILLAFILAAIITPTPDPVNQAIIAVPIIAIYQVGLVAVCLNIWRNNRHKRHEKRLNKKQLKLESKQQRKHKQKSTALKPAVAAAVTRATPTPVIASPVVAVKPVSATKSQVKVPPARTPKRSIDGMIARPQTAVVRQPVRPVPQPAVKVPSRPVPTLPRSVQPTNTRQALSIDGMTRRIVSA